MHAFLFLGLLLPADDTKDTMKIEGTWVVVSATKDGKPGEEIQDDKLTFKDGLLTHASKKTEGKGTYKLDPSAKPSTIDIVEEGKDKPFRGIYRLEGDKLVICMSIAADDKRPTEFAAKAGSGQMLVELKREKK
jgi:uncharacterized protein (TIGR03067 family)